jgi:hypothetical protein
MARLAAGWLTIALMVAACQQPALACNEPDMLVPDPKGRIVPGVRLGPLLLSTGMWNGEQVGRVPWSRPEDLPKFLIARVDRFEQPLTLTGRRCEDGRGLRFATGVPWQFDANLTLEEIARRTNPSIAIDASPPAEVQQIGEVLPFGGYFIFTAPGRWRIEAHDGERVVASAIIEVFVGRWEVREVPSGSPQTRAPQP